MTSGLMLNYNASMWPLVVLVMGTGAESSIKVGVRDIAPRIGKTRKMNY